MAHWGQMANVRTAVYRLYDDWRNLLYVGVTSNPPGRFSKHRYQKVWWSRVEAIDLEWFDTRAEAFAEERRAILAENPIYNIARPKAVA